MGEKPTNPYTRLLERAKDLARMVKYPKRRSMWTYPKSRLGEGWALVDLAERVKAADQLDYDVLLRNVDGDLRVEYVARPNVPWDWA